MDLKILEKIEDIKKISLEILTKNIEEGDLDSISFYLANMDILLESSLLETCVNKLKNKIENGDIKAISVFYNYVYYKL